MIVSGVNSKDGKITYAAHSHDWRTQSLGYFFSLYPKGKVYIICMT